MAIVRPGASDDAAEGPQHSGGRRNAAFLPREEWRLTARGRKLRASVAARRSRASARPRPDQARERPQWAGTNSREREVWRTSSSSYEETGKAPAAKLEARVLPKRPCSTLQERSEKVATSAGRCHACRAAPVWESSDGRARPKVSSGPSQRPSPSKPGRSGWRRYSPLGAPMAVLDGGSGRDAPPGSPGASALTFATATPPVTAAPITPITIAQVPDASPAPAMRWTTL